MTIKKKSRRYWLFLLMRCIIWLGATISVAILVLPSFNNALCGINQVTVIGGYETGIQQKSQTEQRALLDAARDYNGKIAREQKQRPFLYSPVYEDELYDSILRINEESNVMAYVEAPSGRVYLPIVHGTADADLAIQAGHLYGTSVPVGGPSTHSVIAAHTGLPEADLFTHLTDMKEGDEFYIHVLGEKLIYTVDSIRVVLPENGNDYLQVEEGADYVTLYTCTPYGVNSHRLLVRGTRTGTAVREIAGGSQLINRKKDNRAVALAVFWGAIPLLVFTVGAFFTFRITK